MEVGDLSRRSMNPVEQSPIFFRSMVAANKAGKAALKRLLAKSTPDRLDEKPDPISRHGFLDGLGTA